MVDSEFLELSRKLLSVTTKLRQAEKAKIVYEENPNYTRGALIADFGGAMGLMLGLNILDVLVFSGSVLKLIVKKIRKGLTKINIDRTIT